MTTFKSEVNTICEEPSRPKNEIHLVRKGESFEEIIKNQCNPVAKYKAEDFTIVVYNEDGTMFDIGTAPDGICVTKPEGAFEHVYEELHVFTKFTKEQLDHTLFPLKALREIILGKTGE